MQKILNQIVRYGLYVTAFLVPIFFWPSTHLPVLANKQLLASFLCGLLLLIWIIKIMATGRARFKWDKITMTALLLLLVFGISTIFSTAARQSFLGMAFEVDTFFGFILYSLVFLLFSNLTANKIEALRAVKAFLAGIGVAAVLFLISTLFGSIFPWDFAKLAGFNTVGMVSSLAVLFGGALMIDVVLFSQALKNTKKQRKSIFIAEIVIGVLLFVCLVLINYWAAWVLVGLSCLLIIWIKGFSREAVIPVCLLVLALLFVVLNIPTNPTNKLAVLPQEAILGYQDSFSVAKGTVLQGINEFLLGSGPATFAHDYDLFRPVSVNFTGFWQFRFTQGVAVFLTLLATCGILGLLALLYLMASFFYFGFKSILKKAPEQVFGREASECSSVKLVIFTGGFYFLAAWLFHPIDFTLMFSGFFLLGLWTAVFEGRTAKCELKNMPPQKSFFIMLLCIVLIIVVIAGFYMVSRNYAAALAFDRGVELVKKSGTDLEKGLDVLTDAAETAKNDDYFRNLSQAFLIRISQVLDDTSIEDPKVRLEILQGLVDAAEGFAGRAITIDQNNSENWTNLADIYAVLARDLGLSKAHGLAVSSYEGAKKLAPTNPLIFYKSALVSVAYTNNLKARFASLEKSGEDNKELETALSNLHQEQINRIVADLQEALRLKSDFTEAEQLLNQLTVRE